MNLFFARKPKVTPKDSIVELRNTLQMLEKRETFLQTKIDNELKIAKANATKNRRGKHLSLLSLSLSLSSFVCVVLSLSFLLFVGPQKALIRHRVLAWCLFGLYPPPYHCMTGSTVDPTLAAC